MRYYQKVLAAIAIAGAVATTGGAETRSSDAAVTCHEIAGPPTAAAPVSREALIAYFNTLAEARPHCEVAVIGADPDAEALFHLAVVMQREGVHERAIGVFEMAAEAGVAAAHTKLADYYNFGIGPVREDLRRAVEEYEKAMAGGDTVAMATMAMMYQLGRGVPQDYEKMIALLKASAEAGYHFAQFRLAELYMKPDAIPSEIAARLDLPDPIKAADLYEKAAQQGSVEARAALDGFISGEMLSASPEIRLKWLRYSASQGDPEALNQLGLMHELGDGVEYDPARAASLYISALEAGLPVQRLRVGPNGRAPRWDRETALEFQVILQDRGLYRGPLDAIIGRGTMAAAGQVAAQGRKP